MLYTLFFDYLEKYPGFQLDGVKYRVQEVNNECTETLSKFNKYKRCVNTKHSFPIIIIEYDKKTLTYSVTYIPLILS